MLYGLGSGSRGLGAGCYYKGVVVLKNSLSCRDLETATDGGRERERKRVGRERETHNLR